MIFKALIIDDEPAARDQLEALLVGYRDFQVMGAAENVDNGLALTLSHRPDVLFLDIDMPGKNGFQLIEQIRGMTYAPAIVFITAFDKFAIRAIKESALDYLLKPIDPQEFERCIEKIRSFESRPVTEQSFTSLVEKLQKPARVGFNYRNGTIFIDPEEIIYCKADGNYTEIHLGGGRTELITMNLGEVNKILSQAFFIRLGRSCILNMKFLERIVRAERKVVLQKDSDLHEVTLSKKSLRQLEEAVSL